MPARCAARARARRPPSSSAPWHMYVETHFAQFAHTRRRRARHSTCCFSRSSPVMTMMTLNACVAPTVSCRASRCMHMAECALLWNEASARVSHGFTISVSELCAGITQHETSTSLHFPTLECHVVVHTRISGPKLSIFPSFPMHISHENIST